MENHNYKSNLELVLKNLEKQHQELIYGIINLGLAGEFHEIDEAFEVGDTFEFSVEMFENSNDINVNLLFELLEKNIETYEKLMNLNPSKIYDDE
ncbi:MAG: hypothetical protein EA341_18775 [Mongoliibacter sp.]|jgi:hypothetical protein|uniref:hypothetical protein n=1 Tax=Mongoliibacter sp. TaxID=2022438 RepID=UPI0012F284AB|nr:hypothetical protein [Mongoliibacter sp.]TVP43072.1 MAG: hypothetical protein EA341_18775 [Mongoliibacter sp.]